MTATDFRPLWRTEQPAPGRAKITATAIGQQLLGHHLTACGAEDMEILGLTEIPEPRAWMWPVTKGTDDERRARIDAFAKRYGVKAYADPAAGQYKAVLTFGPVELVVYMLTEQDLTARLAAIHEAVLEDRARVYAGIAS